MKGKKGVYKKPDVNSSLDFIMASEMDNSVSIPTDFEISSEFDTINVDNDKSTDKFIYAYTESGVSKNKRRWTPDSIRSIGQQVLAKLPCGHLGHIKPDDAGYSLPEPQVVWFGKTEEPLDTGEIRLWLKGYVLPTADKAKVWIKNKAINSISVWGVVRQHDEDGIMVIDDVDLKAIDLSRKLGEGLPAFIVDIASEMDGSIDELAEEIRKKLYKFVNPENKDIRIDAYPRKIYLDKVIFEIYENGGSELYRANYVIDEKGEVHIDFANMKPVQLEYVEKKNKTEGKKMDISNLTYAELKEKNPTLVQEMIADYESSNKKEKEDAETLALAQEMRSIMQTLDVETSAEASELVLQHIAFATEMAEEMEVDQFVEEVAGEQAGCSSKKKKSVTDIAGEIKAKNKTAKDEKDGLNAVVSELLNIAKVSDKDALKTKLSELLDAERKSYNEGQIKSVKETFDELTKGVDNEVALEYLLDDFADILNAKAEDIKEMDWGEKSSASLKEKLPERLKKHLERLAKIADKAKIAGEMSNIANLGNGMQSSNPEKKKTYDEMTPDEIAESLGYK